MASGPATTKSRTYPNQNQNPPDSLRQGASQAAGAAPTLRYGPAGDSAPRLRLKASGMTERFPFGPSTRPQPLVWSCSGGVGEWAIVLAKVANQAYSGRSKPATTRQRKQRQ